MAEFAILLVGVFLIFGTSSVVGALTVKRAEEVELKQIGYLVAIVAGVLALLIPLWLLVTSPIGEEYYTESESGDDRIIHVVK